MLFEELIRILIDINFYRICIMNQLMKFLSNYYLIWNSVLKEYIVDFLKNYIDNYHQEINRNLETNKKSAL